MIKQSKNLKAALTGVVIVASFIAMVMAIIVSTTTGPNIATMSYFYSTYGEAADLRICINWPFAGLYFTMLAVALIGLVTKFAMFTVPAIKDRTDGANIALICEIIGLIGLILGIICLFLPEGMKLADANTNKFKDLMRATVIAGWISAPLAFITSLGTIGLNRLSK